MCGICGELTFAPRAPDGGAWDALIDRMWRRGPDDRGRWDDGAHCLLGCRRLAIMDPGPAGHLPMQAPSGHVLAFNGELYNFRELRAELQARGHRFASRGDTEVALAALVEWGERALERFNGMFALACYDPRARSLLLARDHAGIKPLYWLRHREGVLFASEFTQLMAHPWAAGLPRCAEAVAMYLRLGHIPAPLALLEDTHQLEPGCWIRFGAEGRVERGRYFAFPRRTGAPLAGGEAVEAVEAAVRAAVRRQMVSDVPVGSFLSGGVDSPLVAACMVEAAGGPVDTFSVGLEDPGLDESAEAARYAALLGTRHHLERLEGDQVLGLLDEVLDATREPLADEGMFPTLLVSRLARRRVKVALSGEGGDELFWGYVPRQDALLRGPARPGVPPGHRYLGFFTDFRRDQFEACFPGLCWWPAGHPFYDFAGGDADETADWMRWNEFTAYLPFILLKTDRASMFHSLEVRVPLLDREVVEVACRVGHRDCVDLAAGVGKLPLRRALRRTVPWQTRAKKGFTVPMDAWVRGPLAGEVHRSLATRRGLEEVEVDGAALDRLFARHVSGEENNGMALWRIFLLDRWTERARAGARQGGAWRRPRLEPA
jgi:asparagine synthase (glutamine-hydrolysing)